MPVVTAEFQTGSGAVEAMDLFVDSGAIISLLRRSTATLLGLSIESGRRISLTNVGGGKTEAFVHNLPIRFAAREPQLIVPFAIATKESVPQLLGRLGVFDALEVSFDPRRRQTRIAFPPAGGTTS